MQQTQNMRRWMGGLAVVVALVVWPLMARAQFSDVEARLQVLEAEIAALRANQQYVGQSGAGGASIANLGIRIDQLENTLRRLTGQLEKLQHQVNQMEVDNRRQIEGLARRLAAIEAGGGGEVATMTPMPQPGLGQAAAQPSQAQPAQPQPGSAQPPQPQASDQRVVTLDQQGGGRGAPPQTLGTIGSDKPLTGDGARPVFEVMPGQPLGTEVTSTQAANGPEAEFEAGLALMRAGNFDAAQARLSGFVAANPNSALTGDALYWIGETHYVRGAFDKAAESFLQTFRDHPKSRKAPDALLKLGMTLGQLGLQKEACLTLGEVKTRYPKADAQLLRRAQIEAKRVGCS